jgi:hypothetical protein
VRYRGVPIGQAVRISSSEATVKFAILSDEEQEEYELELIRKLKDPGSSAYKDVMRAELVNMYWIKMFHAIDKMDDESRRIILAQIEKNVKDILNKKRKYQAESVVKTAGVVAAAAVVIPAVVLTGVIAAMLGSPEVFSGAASWSGRRKR